MAAMRFIFALLIALVLIGLPNVHAQEFPQRDSKKFCEQASEKYFARCLPDEEKAKNHLQAFWSRYTAEQKYECGRLDLPTYVQFYICFERRFPPD